MVFCLRLMKNGDIKKYFPHSSLSESALSKLIRFIPSIPSRNHICGLTTVELLITLVLISLIAAIAIPSMTFIVAKNGVDNAVEELFGSIMLARSEAIKAKTDVSVCVSEDQSSCATSGSDWSTWLIFVDQDSNGTLDSQDRLLRKVAVQDESALIMWNNGLFLSFNSRGQTVRPGTFVVCDKSDEGLAQAIVVSMSGRPRIEVRTQCQ